MVSDDTAYRRLSEPAYHGAFVARYNQLRPTPPADLITLLAQLAPTQPPRLVVDLGSGTGISTVAWADHAERVIGIDQNPEMLAVVAAQDGASGCRRLPQVPLIGRVTSLKRLAACRNVGLTRPANGRRDRSMSPR